MDCRAVRKGVVHSNNSIRMDFQRDLLTFQKHVAVIVHAWKGSLSTCLTEAGERALKAQTTLRTQVSFNTQMPHTPSMAPDLMPIIEQNVLVGIDKNQRLFDIDLFPFLDTER